jgi:hypothetical protein
MTLKDLRKIVEIQLQAAQRAGDTTNAAKYANVLENIKAQEVARAKLATPKVASSQTRFFKDTEGNRYARIMEIDQLGKTTFQLTPLEGSPESPVGRLAPVGSQGMTEKERINAAADEAAAVKQAENWADRSNTIINAGFAAIEEIPKLEKVLAVVEDPEFTSGGLYNVLEEFQNFFGLGSADVGEFKNYTAKILTEELDAFTGAISNAEREYLERNLANFKQSPEINKRLLRNILEGFKQARAKALVFAEGDPNTGEEWKQTAWLKFVNNNRFVGANGNGVSEPTTREVSLNEVLGNNNGPE